MMHRITLFLLIVCAGSSLKAEDTAVTAEPMQGAEFLQVLTKRQVKLSGAQVETLQRFLVETSPKGAAVLQEKLENRADIAVIEILPHIVNKEGCHPVLASLKAHPDMFLRFVVNCGLAGSGDSEASEVIHRMLHDERLEKLDQRLIKSWALGTGINPSKDDAKSILKHLMNLIGKGQKLRPGDDCPEFLATTDADVELSLKTLKGQVIILHFWSSSCGPCLAQMPQHIETLSRLPKDETVVVFVSLDESKEQFKASVERHKMPFHNVCDASGWGGTLARTFGVKQLPFDIVIDRGGKIFSNSILTLPAPAE